MARIAVDEVVLAAMGLIGDHHDVAAFRQDRVPVALLLGEELLNGGKHHAARFDRELGAQIRPACRLHRRLAQQLPAAGEGAEELVVQVVPVRQHDEGGVGHGRLANDAPGIEGHAQALARALGMPDYADAPVARRTARFAARLVTVCLVFDPGVLRSHLAQFGRPQGLGDRHLHRMELVVAGHLLD